MATGIDSFFANPLAGTAVNTGFNLLGEVFSSRKKRKATDAQLDTLEKKANKELTDAYTALEDNLSSSYAASELENTYRGTLGAAYQKGRNETNESFNKAKRDARKANRSTLGSIFFG